MSRKEDLSDPTNPSLLIRIKDSSNVDAWQEFFDLYSPLLYSYAVERGLRHEDAEDIRASCYESIVKHIQQFDYSEKNTGFRAWLRTMVTRRVIDLLRKKKPQVAESSDLRNLEANQESVDELWEKNWRLHHLRHCVAQVGKKVQPQSYEAFRLLTEHQLSVEEVCKRLEMNPAQVHQIKSRFLRLVRTEMQQFDLEE